MRHMNQTQRDVWRLNTQGYKLTYPHTHADFLLLKSEIIKNASSFSGEDIRVAKRVFETPRLAKTASQKDTLKSKLYKAVLTDLAEEESKNIEGGAKKGLALIKRLNGVDDPLDILKSSGKADKDSPLYKMLENRLKGASASDKSNLVGYLALALKDKDISRIAKILNVEEETALVLIVSMNGTVSPEEPMRELFKDLQKKTIKTGGATDVIKALEGETDTFMGKAIPSISVKWYQIFSEAGRGEVKQFFSDIFHWMDPVEIVPYEGNRLMHPLEAMESLKDNLIAEFWNETRALPKYYFNYVKNFFIVATTLLKDLLVSLWELDWEKAQGAIMGIGSVVIISVSVYLIFLAIAHLQVWLLSLPRKLLLDWPLKITLFLYEKIALGVYNLGKAALTFLTSQEAREAYYKGLSALYNKSVESFRNFSFKDLFRDTSHDYMKNPDALLETMV